MRKYGCSEDSGHTICYQSFYFGITYCDLSQSEMSAEPPLLCVKLVGFPCHIQIFTFLHSSSSQGKHTEDKIAPVARFLNIQNELLLWSECPAYLLNFLQRANHTLK